MKIYKEVVYGPINTPFDIDVKGEIISIQKQRNVLVFYYIVKPNIEKTYTFVLAETGADFILPSDMNFMGTFMLDNDTYVLHTFMKLKKFEVDY